MTDVESREPDFRNPTSYEDVIFGFEDLDVFEIKDVKERSAAVQELYFPRLELIRDHTLGLISEIYGVDPRVRSSYVYRPMPREEAKKPLEFHEVMVGIIGKGSNNALLNIKRQNEGAYNLNPSQLHFVISDDGEARVEFVPFRYPKVGDDYVLSFRKLFEEQRDDVEALFAVASLTHPFAEELRPLRDLFSIRRHDMVYQRIQSAPYSVPLFDEARDQLVFSFVAMYPFFAYGCSIAEGRDSQFASLVARLRKWLKESGESLDEE